MIYILSGIAKSGKTTIAKEFTKRYNIPYFSTDYIMMMLYRGNSKLNIDPEASDMTVSEQIKPYVLGMIKTMVENKVDYLIEGVHFNPGFSSELLKQYPNDIRVVYLGFKNTSVNLKLIELNKYRDMLENVWYSSFSKEEMIKLVSYLIEESERLYRSCIEYSLDYIDIYDLTNQLDDIINYIMN